MALGSQCLQSSYFSFNKLVTLRKLADEQSSLNDILQKCKEHLAITFMESLSLPLEVSFLPLEVCPMHSTQAGGVISFALR